MKDYPRGSEWRRWDLHVHTASSYDSKYNGNDSDDILTQAWKKMDFAAVAITDHFIIDKERINNLHKLIPNITIFPGVELRTDKGASNIHVILLFSEKKNLDALIEDFNSFKRNNAKNPEDNHKIYWDFEEILKFAKTQNALISLHAGSKTNGLDDMISNSVPVNEAIKEEFAKNVNFFEMGKIEDISNYKTHVFPTIGEKPLIICSDNHDPRNYSIKEYLWIKADPTFEGLIQCINQPEERTFVGDIPIKLDIANKNKQRYIESITVKKIEIPKNPSSNWFDFDIPINSGLTAIIGNKGSGKSALSDIIGHCCQSHAIAKHASFLHQDRFRKKKLADDYEGLIRWLDGEDDKKISLGELKYSSSIENAQYLPQKYIESVCNDLDNEFQDEINKVIFSYVDVTEKGTAKNLEELIESKSITLKTQIIDLQKKLSEINDEIITAEEKLVSSYEISLRENLIKRKDDLERHEKNKPSEIEKPEKSQSDDYVIQLSILDKQVLDLEQEIEKTINEAKEINEKITELNVYKDKIVILTDQADSLNLSLLGIAKKYEFDSDSFKITITTPTSIIIKKIEDLSKSLRGKQSLLDVSDQSDENSSLQKKLIVIKNQKMGLISSADANEKSYQRYLDNLKIWEKAKSEIIGDNFTEGTIRNIENELNYVTNILRLEYNQLKENRLELVSKLFEQKKAMSIILSSIYKPIENELKKLSISIDDNIEFVVNIGICDSDINSKLLDQISKQFSGIFAGIAESQIKMDEIIKDFDFNNSEGVKGFITEVLKCIDEDINISSKKVKDKKKFYNLLTFLNYLDAEYSLNMSGRSLKELSAGQRGIVLLIFYLALSKNDIPIIIDQPEDNLDNQSVFDKLVPCIREAKKKRQVIIVTHNPNIAIACDAEQICYCSIDKITNKITYTSGSIENQVVKKHVIDVLEGTMPAFDLRRKKYSN